MSKHRLYIIVETPPHTGLAGVANLRTVIFDRLRGAFIKPRIYQGGMVDMVATPEAVAYARNDAGDGLADWSGPRSGRETPAIRYTPGASLAERTDIAVAVFDAAGKGDALGDPGYGTEFACLMADLLEEWRGSNA